MSLTDGLTNIFEAVLAAAVETYVPDVMLTPSADPYGRDISGVNDIDELFAEVEGDEALAQALARRLITPRGNLIDDEDYGLDLRSYLNRKMSPSELAALPSQVINELTKEERVSSVECKLTIFEQDVQLELDISVTTADGSFRFTFALTPSSVDVLLADTE